MTKSKIGWTEEVWNFVTGCDWASVGCDNCYAKGIAARWKAAGSPKYQLDGDPRTSGPGFGVQVHEDLLLDPITKRRPRMIFVNSMGDWLHPKVPDEVIARSFAVMALTRRHTYQLLTKRSTRLQLLNRPDFREAVAEHATDLIGSLSWKRWQLDLGGARVAGDSGLGGDWTVTPTPNGNHWAPPWPLPNVWVGVSAENQEQAERRIPRLAEAQAAVRWVSGEPLLGETDLMRWLDPPCPDDPAGVHHIDCCCPKDPTTLRPDPLLDWVVVGGESGSLDDIRRMDPRWARNLRDQCRDTSVPFFFKQLGTVLARDLGLRSRAGSDSSEWPEHYRWPQEYPLSAPERAR